MLFAAGAFSQPAVRQKPDSNILMTDVDSLKQQIAMLNQKISRLEAKSDNGWRTVAGRLCALTKGPGCDTAFRELIADGRAH